MPAQMEQYFALTNKYLLIALPCLEPAVILQQVHYKQTYKQSNQQIFLGLDQCKIFAYQWQLLFIFIKICLDQLEICSSLRSEISIYIESYIQIILTSHTAVHRDAFFKFPFRLIYYCYSSKSNGKETCKTHL